MGNTTSRAKLLSAGSILVARVNVSQENRIEYKEHIIENLRINGKTNTRSKKDKVGIAFELLDDLYINLGSRKLMDCRCRVPALGRDTKSVNSTYTAISQATEGHRRNPGGSAIEECAVKEFINGAEYWTILKDIRDKLVPIKKIRIDEIPSYLSEHEDLLQEIARNNITKEDIIAIGYRKSQIEVFSKLLRDSNFFKTYRDRNSLTGEEAVWQHFFEQNPWIFGYGLSYIFTSPLIEEKLEQVVQGFSFYQRGKRVDALMQTAGIVSSLYFVEIKTHNTRLLKHESYRADCWPPSDDLAGGLSQIQKTVQKAITNIREKLELKNKNGDPTGEVTYAYRPRSSLVIGNLDEFRTAKGVNEEKYSSFEVFRQSIIGTEIITFDELFERARYIIQRSEK